MTHALVDPLGFLVRLTFATYYPQNSDFLEVAEDSHVGRAIQEGQYNGDEDKKY